MDYLWSPWRFQYVSEGTKTDGCVFCRVSAEAARDAENFVLHRGQHNFILLNLFPYTSGHAMIAPYAHQADFSQLDSATVNEMMRLAQQLQAALQAAYHPDGYNLGMNLGQSAGAGVADHLHLHVLPRWSADANFMTVIGETRVLPEDLSTTYQKLSRFFRS